MLVKVLIDLPIRVIRVNENPMAGTRVDTEHIDSLLNDISYTRSMSYTCVYDNSN